METDVPWGENPQGEVTLRGPVSEPLFGGPDPWCGFSFQHSILLTPWKILRSGPIRKVSFLGHSWILSALVKVLRHTVLLS